MLIATPALRLGSEKKIQGDCEAGKSYCYNTPIHLDAPINTPGFEGGPSLSASGLELYFPSDRPGALGGARRQLLLPMDDNYFCRRRVSKGAPLSTAAELGNCRRPVAGHV
jgi:hypothetical protein